jgi:hypothetical protein
VTEKDQVLTEQSASRRRFLKQAGAVAWGAPLIVTMMSRAAHAQAVCGTQALDANPPFALLCNETAPCGTAAVCAPDPGDLGAGNNCICQAP